MNILNICATMLIDNVEFHIAENGMQKTFIIWNKEEEYKPYVLIPLEKWQDDLQRNELIKWAEEQISQRNQSLNIAI